MRRYRCAALAPLAALTLSAAPGASQGDTPTGRCERLVGTEISPGLTITGATHVAASATPPTADAVAPGREPLPAYCKVEGTIDPHKGADGKDYAIGFALALPDAWNGRFLLQGGGGLNGSVGAPVGPVAAGDRPALARGFAVISHDSGHKGPVFDAAFMADQRAALDFAEASVRTVTLAGKALTERYYGRAIAHSYMTGCSTGGREGMLALQRYPELFDGIVIGAPAMRKPTETIAPVTMEMTRDLQTILTRRGHNVGGVDGKLGLATRQAVKLEQVKLGLPADSYPTPELLERLKQAR